MSDNRINDTNNYDNNDNNDNSNDNNDDNNNSKHIIICLATLRCSGRWTPPATAWPPWLTSGIYVYIPGSPRMGCPPPKRPRRFSGAPPTGALGGSML